MYTWLEVQGLMGYLTNIKFGIKRSVKTFVTQRIKLNCTKKFNIVADRWTYCRGTIVHKKFPKKKVGPPLM